MKTICVMRDLYKALAQFEVGFEKVYGVSLNEAMVLCSLNEAQDKMTSSAIAERTEMSPSHTSKVISNIEDKAYVRRSLGKEDKRLMLFELTPKGQELVDQFVLDKVEIPALIKPLFES